MTWKIIFEDEALKAGEYDFRREYIARNWATAYDTLSGFMIAQAYGRPQAAE